MNYYNFQRVREKTVLFFLVQYYFYAVHYYYIGSITIYYYKCIEHNYFLLVDVANSVPCVYCVGTSKAHYSNDNNSNWIQKKNINNIEQFASAA